MARLTLPAVSTYVTGFCGIGAHEAQTVKSESGAVLKSCPPGGRFSADRIGQILCMCECHDTTRELEELTKVQFPATIINRQTPALSRALHVPSGTTGSDGAPVSGQAGRPTVVVASGRTFVATPSGRAQRGQLEEQVRHACEQQVKFGGADMIALLGLRPETLALMIDRENPPSTGAIYSVLKRWERTAFVELAADPFRFVRFTPLGERNLVRGSA